MELCILLSPTSIWYQSRLQRGYWITLWWYIHVRVHNRCHHQAYIFPCIIYHGRTVIANGTPTATFIRRTSNCIDISSSNTRRKILSGRNRSQLLSVLINSNWDIFSKKTNVVFLWLFVCNYIFIKHQKDRLNTGIYNVLTRSEFANTGTKSVSSLC